MKRLLPLLSHKPCDTVEAEQAPLSTRGAVLTHLKGPEKEHPWRGPVWGNPLIKHRGLQNPTVTVAPAARRETVTVC